MKQIIKAPKSTIDTILFCSGWKKIFQEFRKSEHLSLTNEKIIFEDYFTLWNVPNTSLLALTETYLGVPVSPTQAMVIFALTKLNAAWIQKIGFAITAHCNEGDLIRMYLRSVQAMPKLDNLLGMTTGADEESLLIDMAWQPGLFPNVSPGLKDNPVLPWWFAESKVTEVALNHLEDDDSIRLSTALDIKAALTKVDLAKYYDWSNYA